MRPAAYAGDRGSMWNNAADGAAGTRPARIMIIDDHEISRAACRALLRTEGADVVADMAAGDPAIAAAAALRPDVAVVDVSPLAGAGFGMARRLLALPGPPAVVLTSSAERAEFGGRLNGHSFVAKAGLCAQAIRDGVPGSPAARPPELHRPCDRRNGLMIVVSVIPRPG
jgi:CheY-like chemotaxis protein